MVVRLDGSHAVFLQTSEVYLYQSASHIPDQVSIPDTALV
jgi:hypothetical protein